MEIRHPRTLIGELFRMGTFVYISSLKAALPSNLGDLHSLDFARNPVEMIRFGLHKPTADDGGRMAQSLMRLGSLQI
jgi:hypothetical protein